MSAAVRPGLATERCASTTERCPSAAERRASLAERRASSRIAFIRTNASALASVLTTGTNQELDDAIITLGGHASNQSQTFIEAKGATQTQESLRKELLQFHMAPINRIAKLKLSAAPELASFLMPRSKLPIQTLKGFADGMAAAAAKYSATFIAAGLPTDFIGQLDAVTTAMVNANTSRDETSKRRQGVTENLQAMLTMGRGIVHVLDPLVRKVIGKDPGLLKNWKAAKRELRGPSPARPGRPRLVSSFCSSPRRSRYAASFSAPLTVGALRFTRVVATNSPEDFHLQVDVRAGHTKAASR